MQYVPALKVLHRIGAKFSLAAPLKSVLVCASVGCFFLVLLEELTSCYADNIFKVISAKCFSSHSSPPKKAAVSTETVLLILTSPS